MRIIHRFPAVSAWLFGSIAVLGYAPFYIYPVTILAIAGLFYLWSQEDTSCKLGIAGFAFGLGLFGTGVSWLFISLHDFGGMPWLLAAVATGLFCAFLALFPAAVGLLLGRMQVHSRWMLAPVLWVLIEWVRGWLFTGFPWLVTGYSQIPYSPLAGLAPVLGVYGVSLAAAFCSAIIAAGLTGRLSKKQAGLWLLLFWVAGSLLGHVEWSQPFGNRVSFSLLQGNIAQDLKWREDELEHTLKAYRQMVEKSRSQVIVLPEMAFPVLMENLPQDYLEALSQHALRNGGDVLVGVPEAQRKHGEIRYFNSMLSFGASSSQVYRKSHLVPFGEFIPFKPLIGWVYRNLLHIPLADLTPGESVQPPMALAGQKVAINICYEDVFGEEIIHALPEATLLLNVSNDAWYGRSLAAHQHLQMSQARALETSRVVLRATNTGATAIIGHDGRVLAEVPHFTTASLEGVVQGRTGETPYVRWGNTPAIVLVFLIIGVLWGRKKK